MAHTTSSSDTINEIQRPGEKLAFNVVSNRYELEGRELHCGDCFLLLHSTPSGWVEPVEVRIESTHHQWYLVTPWGNLVAFHNARFARSFSSTPAMSESRFNQLLNGPLSHPMVLFRISRLSLALASVVAATGSAGAAALEQHCEEREIKDRSQG